ncbi:MAG: NADH-quinone oxidoreductase subunit NuoE [Methylobacterium radiotolerans]
MANRRLAPASEQPESFAFSPENAEWAKTQIAKYPEGRQASAVISLLWRAQEQNGGWLPRAAIEAVAAELGMPNIRVLEVATFYTMFALEPVGRFWIQVCGTVPCDSCGARGLKEMLQARLGPAGHVSADGNFSWLEVECLGACCNAPMVQINQDYYEDLTPESLGQLMDDLAAGRPVKVGSQTGRVSSEPRDAVNTLTDPTLFDGSRVGAWRKRFEEAGKAEEPAAQTGEAASSTQQAAENPKPARPDAGRPGRASRERRPGPARRQRREPGEARGSRRRGRSAAAPPPSTAPPGGRRGTCSTRRPSASPRASPPPASRATRRCRTATPSRSSRRPPAPARARWRPRPREARIAGALAALPKDASPEQKADAVGKRPPGLEAARAGKPDELTRIKGIGPGQQPAPERARHLPFRPDRRLVPRRDRLGSAPTSRSRVASTGRTGWGQAKALSAPAQ